MLTFSGHHLTTNPKQNSFSNIFSRLGVLTAKTPFLSGTNKAGAAFFQIDSNYLVQIQKKEFFELVGYGFSEEYLNSISIEERRYYYHLLVAKNNPNSGTEFKYKNQQNK